MRVVVFGASGNVGTSVVRALQDDEQVDEVIGAARRLPRPATLGIEWQQADVSSDDLVPLLRGADVAVHLAWALHPVRDPARLHAINVIGSRRVFEAVAEASVPALVYASSVGAYSPSSKQILRDESYPTDGIESSSYSRQKAYVERLLDAFELCNPSVRVVRLRPSLTFKSEAAHEIRRLFLGRLLPARLIREDLLPAIPDIPGLAFQAVHTEDAADAYRRVVTGTVRGPINIAADPVLTPGVLAKAFGARTVPVPAPVARMAAAASFHLRLQPSEPGWFDMAMQTPILDTSRARTELGWEPKHSGIDTVKELLAAMRTGEPFPTPQLTEPGRAA